jgi:hypothetical protein
MYLILNEIYVFILLKAMRGWFFVVIFSPLFQGERPSIRERDLEAKAMLQLAGKTLHSEGMDDNADEAWQKKMNENNH